MQQKLFPGKREIVSNILPKDGVVEMHPGFFTENECDILFPVLINETEWKQDSMKFYGKKVNLPRLTAWYGASMKEYSYSGIDMKAKPWTQELLFIKNRIEKNCGL